MTKKQAFLAALRGETPDIVPVSPLIHHRYAQKLLGRSDWKAVFEVHQKLGTTHYRGPVAIDVKLPAMPGYEQWDEALVEEGAHKVTRNHLKTPVGTLTSVYDIGLIPDDPLVGKEIEYFVKGPKDWETIIRMWNDEADAAQIDPGEQVREACQVMGEDGVPSVGIISAYSMLGNARGMGELLYDLYDEPDLVREAMKAAWRRTEKKLDSFIASPSDFCYYDICWATGSEMGPELFAKWTAEEMQMACDKIRKAGKYISFYTLGRIGKLMDTMVDSGPYMIASFEPNQGDISLAEAKKKYGKRICLMGNVDCMALAFGTVEDTRKEAIRCLNEAKGDGGYIMGSADEIPADAKFDNLKAMVDVAQEYGRY
jgi:uroporphyrinogen-III decarboxylase